MTLSINETFAGFFLSTRMEQGLSQRDVAEKIGVNQSYMTNLETGKARISIERYLRFCDALEIDPAEPIRRYHAGEELYSPPETIVVRGVTYRKADA